jgi:hypothetical protein
MTEMETSWGHYAHATVFLRHGLPSQLQYGKEIQDDRTPIDLGMDAVTRTLPRSAVYLQPTHQADQLFVPNHFFDPQYNNYTG